MESDVFGLLEFWIGVAHWLTGVGTIALAIALYRTFSHLGAATKMSKIETEFRLRPWIGPSSSITKMDDSINGDVQFSILVKNFGDLPASGVKVKSIVDINPLTRDSLKQPLSEFDLGPLLPNMEKRYWFFASPSIWEKVSKEDKSLYVAIYFEYPSLAGSNGYGMISEYKNQTFVHKEMWIDYPEIKF
jgi:hypothetical protein